MNLEMTWPRWDQDAKMGRERERSIHDRMSEKSRCLMFEMRVFWVLHRVEVTVKKVGRFVFVFCNYLTWASSLFSQLYSLCGVDWEKRSSIRSVSKNETTCEFHLAGHESIYYLAEKIRVLASIRFIPWHVFEKGISSLFYLRLWLIVWFPGKSLNPWKPVHICEAGWATYLKTIRCNIEELSEYVRPRYPYEFRLSSTWQIHPGVIIWLTRSERWRVGECLEQMHNNNNNNNNILNCEFVMLRLRSSHL